MIEGAIISIIQRETQNRTLAINTGQNLFPTFFGQRLQASIYRYLKHLLSETIHPKVDHFSDNDAEGTKRWAKHPAPYPPCGGRFPSTRPQTVLTCLHVYGFPLVTLLFTIVLNHRVAVLTDNQCLAMSFEHQFLPLIIAFQLGESPHMMHDYFSFLTT